MNETLVQAVPLLEQLVDKYSTIVEATEPLAAPERIKDVVGRIIYAAYTSTGARPMQGYTDDWRAYQHLKTSTTDNLRHDLIAQSVLIMNVVKGLQKDRRPMTWERQCLEDEADTEFHQVYGWMSMDNEQLGALKFRP